MLRYYLIPYDTKYIVQIINVIINNSETHMKLLEKIYNDAKTRPDIYYWNSYCKENIQRPCEIPDEPIFYPLEVLQRYIKDKYVILGLTEVNAFYKKYIKYKTKYLELKK
jgi:hypothetical protein